MSGDESCLSHPTGRIGRERWSASGFCDAVCFYYFCDAVHLFACCVLVLVGCMLVVFQDSKSLGSD